MKICRIINVLCYACWNLRVNQAKAVFILSSRGVLETNLADQHTILRSWAIKDFAPNTPQFVQLFRPENVVHVKFAGMNKKIQKIIQNNKM